MLKHTYFSLILTALFITTTEANAGEPYNNLPWHLADVTWTPNYAMEVESLSMDLGMLQPAPDAGKVFITAFNTYLNESVCYFGWDTTIEGQSSATEGQIKYGLGPGLIFSKWGEMQPEAIRPVKGGYYLLSDHEGKHASVRLPYPWGDDKTLTFSLRRMDKEVLDGKPYIWVGAFLTRPSKENVFVGAIRFPGERLMVTHPISNFIELHGSDNNNQPKSVPSFSVGFGNLRVNNAPIKPKTVVAEYSEKIPKYAAAVNTDWQIRQPGKWPKDSIPRGDGAFIIHVSDNQFDRKEKEVQLYPQK